jgi:hypothetical protein
MQVFPFSYVPVSRCNDTAHDQCRVPDADEQFVISSVGPGSGLVKKRLFSNFWKLKYPTILFSIVDDKRFFVETGA